MGYEWDVQTYWVKYFPYPLAIECGLIWFNWDVNGKILGYERMYPLIMTVA